MNNQMNRRSFLRGSLIAGAVTAGFVSPEEKILMAAVDNGADKNIKIPKNPQLTSTGKLGSLTVSRLISGGNLLHGWCHERDFLYVSDLAQAYLTEKKQFETLELTEKSGINSIMIDMDQLDLINKYYKERGGKIQTITSVRQLFRDWENPSFDVFKRYIENAVDKGADTIFLHGGYSDTLVMHNKPENYELIAKSIEHIRQQGLSAGLGSHSIWVQIECDKRGIEPDYFVKTFHHDQYWSATPKEYRKKFCVDMEMFLDHNEYHDNIFCIEPERTIDFMKNKKQPWIAFKVLAAGSIKPDSAFTYAFEHGADFVSVGMFDFQIQDDIVVLEETLKNLKNRERAWCS